MGALITVRPFSADDAAQVRNLFIRFTRLLAPRHMTEVFEAYIAKSLREEVDRIADYYGEKDGRAALSTNQGTTHCAGATNMNEAFVNTPADKKETKT